MNRVIHFEIAVDDPERAAAFYERALGWKVTKWEGPIDYWLVTTGQEGEPGIDGALARREPGSPPVVNTIGVADLEETIRKVEEAGGKLVSRSTIPGVGYLAYLEDTEGNPFGAMQEDPSAR